MPLDDSSPEADAWVASQEAGARARSDGATNGRPAGFQAAGRSQQTASLRPAGEAAGGGHREPSWWTAGSDPVTWLIAGAVTVAYVVISVFRYLRRDPTSWDLGIFTEYVKQYASLRAPIVDIKGGGFNLLGDHFHPIVALIAPFFRLFPSPVTLLVVQAVLIGVSVFPVSQLGRELLGLAAGRSIAAAYGLSWGLQQLANYDFHEIAFSVPLLAFSLSAMVRGRIRTAVLWVLPLVLVKEDQGFTLLAIGLIIAVAYQRHGAGLFLAGWGLFWSLLAITVIIPHFSTQHSYPYWSEAGSFNPLSGNFSVGGLWSTVSAGASTKLPTLVLILLPTAFIALRSPVVLAAVPSLALRVINTTPAYWGTAWHYNATVMPIVFVAAIDALARIRARHPAAAARPVEPGPVEPTMFEPDPQGGPQPAAKLAVATYRYGAAAMLAISVALMFQFPLSSLWAPATYASSPHIAAENQAVALVPDGATVSTDLNLLAPLAARADTYWLGTAGSDPPPQYVVFDTQSTDCSAWESVCAQPIPAAVQDEVQNLAHGARYQQIFSRDGVFVFRRVTS